MSDTIIITSVVTVSPKDIMTHTEGYFSDQVRKQLVDQITEVLMKDIRIHRGVDWINTGVTYRAEVITMDAEKYRKLRRMIEANNFRVQDENGDIINLLDLV